MKPLFFLLWAFALSPTSAWCQASAALAAPVSGALAAPVFDPAQSQPPASNIRMELQVVAIPERIALGLIPDMKSKEKIAGADARIQEMLTKGTAKLIGWPIVTTKSGQRAVIEAIKEIRYAAEYHAPTVNVSDVPADPPAKVTPSVDVTTFAGFPSAFETRNTGVTFEAEPVLEADGKTVNINLVPQHVRLEKFNKVTIEGGAHKGKVVVEQPQFDTNKITTSVTLQSGQRMLMGVYPTDDPPKHLEFFMLKVEVLPVE